MAGGDRLQPVSRVRPGLQDGRSYHLRVAESENQPLADQLEELGAQLAWVREYL